MAPRRDDARGDGGSTWEGPGNRRSRTGDADAERWWLGKDAEWQGDFPEPDNERIVINSMLDGNFKGFFSKFYLSIFFTVFWRYPKTCILKKGLDFKIFNQQLVELYRCTYCTMYVSPLLSQ